MFFFNYYDNKPIAALSYRVYNWTRKYDAYLEHNDLSILKDEQIYNLSFKLAQIIQKLKIPSVSLSAVLNSISRFNYGHGSSIIIQDYFEKGWIRLINDEILIPPVLEKFIWRLNREETYIGDSFTECFRTIYNELFQDKKLTISRSELEGIISKSELSIEYLLSKSIIKSLETDEVFEWHAIDQSRYLRNKIAFSLWINTVGKDESLENYRSFIRLLRKVHIYPDKLQEFLSQSSRERLCFLSLNFLKSESDLINSEIELKKSLLDYPGPDGVSVESSLPYLDLSSTSVEDLLSKLRSLAWYYRDTLILQTTRNEYSLAIQLLIANDVNPRTPYFNVISLFREYDRPFLIYEAHEQITRNYPHVIAFFLQEIELYPILFRSLDSLQINPAFCSNQGTQDEIYKESEEIKNKLWLDAFDILLKHVSTLPVSNDRSNETIFKVVLDLAEAVFSFNNNRPNQSLISHQILRVRYERIFKLLSELRENKNVINPGLSTIPRLFPVLIPSVVQAILKFTKPLPPNELMKLETAFFDCCIEFLKLSSLPLLPNEVSLEVHKHLTDARKELIIFLERKLKEYLLLEEVEFYSYENRVEKKKPKRGVVDFGIEIVDWGYMLVCFQEFNLMQSLDRIFRKSLIFDKDSPDGKYAEQNKEQREKIHIYLRILIVGRIMIFKIKEYVGLDLNSIGSATAKIESLIKYYSTRYSKDNIRKGTIDIFNHWGHVYRSDIYSQPLSKLLYQSINSFSTINKIEFVNSLVQDEKNIASLLAILNKVDALEIQKVIAEKINSLNVEEYLNSSSNLVELEDALIEAINSESHFHIAGPLLEKADKILTRINQHTETTANFIFNIKLLLAYKQKSLEGLESVSIPESKYRMNREASLAYERKKNYYIGLFMLNCSCDYVSAIALFQSLSSQDPGSPDYAFQLHKSKTLSALQ